MVEEREFELVDSVVDRLLIIERDLVRVVLDVLVLRRDLVRVRTFLALRLLGHVGVKIVDCRRLLMSLLDGYR